MSTPVSPLSTEYISTSVLRSGNLRARLFASLLRFFLPRGLLPGLAAVLVALSGIISRADVFEFGEPGFIKTVTVRVDYEQGWGTGSSYNYQYTHHYETYTLGESDSLVLIDVYDSDDGYYEGGSGYWWTEDNLYYSTWSVSYQWIGDGGGGGGGWSDPWAINGDDIPLEGEAVIGSPSVTAEALEAAIDGGSRYLRQFGKNILTALNPQTYADSLGGIVGYVVNIADAGTRTQVADEINEKLQSLTVAQTWKDAGAYLITPEGLADITSELVLDRVPTKFGEVSIASNVPDNIASLAAQRIGATGKYGEDWLAARHGSGPGIQNVHKPIPGTGGRYIDNLDANGVARESKVGYTTLTKFIKEQIRRDVYLRNTSATSGVNSVEWHFFDSEISGPGGPSGPLKAFLDANHIPVYYNGELLPVGPWTKS